MLIRDVEFVNISGTGSDSHGVVGRFDCSAITPCANITLAEVNLASSVPDRNASFFCSNVTGPPPTSTSNALLGDVFPTSCIGPTPA